MKGRTTLILLAVFLALLGYVYLVELRRPTEPAAPDAPSLGPLWSLDPNDITGVIVRSATQETRLARSSAGEWRLEAPAPAETDTGRVTQFVNRLAQPLPIRTLDLTGALEEYGLAPPLLEVTLLLAEGRSEVLRVGATNPQQTAHYLQVQGREDLHLLSTYLVDSMREMLETPPLRPTPTMAPSS